MKRFLFSLLAASTVAGAMAQTFREWQDPEVNAVNRAPMRSAHFAYASDEAALAAQVDSSGTSLTRPFAQQARMAWRYTDTAETSTRWTQATATSA